MKLIFAFLFTIGLFTNSIAQTAEWKEMKDFHSVMSKTFHPAEENNLQPVKDNAGLLLEKAIAWQKSNAPKGFNGVIAKPILETLVKECKDIQKAVADKTDDAGLKKLITKAHETFHELTEKCQPGKEEKH